jgi:type I restriction enzyme M protein
MPLTPVMRQKIDQIRDYLWGGGYPDPLSNAEQLSYLFFFYLIEHIDEDNKLRPGASAARTRACSRASGRCRIL